jgi:isoquinoline 1-oxidoreductase beta subunit
MTATTQPRSLALSRRSVLLSAGGVGVGFAFGAVPKAALAALSPGSFQASAWITVGTNGTVTIMSPASEMGQGVMTSLPLIIAEELDADWHKVRVVQSSDDAKIYGNPGFFGTLTTVGSASVAGYFEKLRMVGAQGRKVLVACAAQSLKVPADELATEPGAVVHKKSGRRMTYAAIARSATMPNPVPEATKADLKPAAQFRLIGKDVGRVDAPLKVNGTARYGIDVQLPRMLYAAVLHPPVQGEKPLKIDDTAAKAVRGIVKIVPMPNGVGVIGDTVEGTKKAKAALRVTWSSDAPGRTYTSEKVAEDYRKAAADWSQPGVAMVEEGDAKAALAGAAKVFSADYFSDHVSHVCMEPMNATVLAKGDTIELWAPNQSPTAMKEICAAVGGTKPEKVTVHTTFLGGGFGRRTDGDEVVEAVILAKAMPGRPIKVIWSREDDVQNDKYRPLTAQHVEIGIDAAGKIVGWRHRIVNESYFMRANPDLLKAFKGKDVVSASGGEFRYAVPAHAVDWVRSPRGVGVGAWRGIAAGYVKFAIETMLDEIAASQHIDPVALRLDLLKGDPRAVAVIQAVAEMADWKHKRPSGRALGIGYSDALRSYTAGIAEVSVDQASGQIRVHKVWAAVDAGRAIQPRNISAQIESAVVMALGAALQEQVNIKDGVVQEANFNSYHVMRMADVPPIEVRVISTDNPPTGIGEAGIPVVAPAIANAVAQLTGKRVRQLPMLPERVKGTAASS